MEPYERIVCAVRHQPTDRPPIDYVATPEFNASLKRHLAVETDEQLLRRLGVDIRRVEGHFVGPPELSGAAGVGALGKDFLGVVWKPMANEFATYNEIAHHPLGIATTVRDIDQYTWPSVDWFEFSHLKEEIRRLNQDRRYAIQLFGGGAFETPWYMRGMSRFLMDLVECPDIAEAICRHVTEFYKQRTLRAIEESDGQIDIILSGGDIGTQRGMMLDPELWRQRIKPFSRQLIATFKDMGLMTYYHSCGSIVPVIEDFIEMGLDILDPIQPKAAGMEAEALKRRFGGRLAFHGGIDEQEPLPRGTPQQVRGEVRRLLDVFREDGGYIVCPAHAVQPDTPVENIVALYDEAGR